MKKALLVLVIVSLSSTLVSVTVLGTLGCVYPSVAGNTYAFYDFEFEYKNGFEGFPEEQIDNLKSQFADYEFAFNEDGSYIARGGGRTEVLYYTQTLGTVYFYVNKIDAQINNKSASHGSVRINGDKLESIELYEDGSFTGKVIFKKK